MGCGASAKSNQEVAPPPANGNQEVSPATVSKDSNQEVAPTTVSADAASTNTDGKVNWTLLGARVEAYEAPNGWVCPNGWYEGIKTANAGQDPAVDKLIEGAAATHAELDAKLGARAKLIRPFAKLRSLSKFNFDAAKAAEAMLAAMNGVDTEGAFKSGLIPEMPGDYTQFPLAFEGVNLAEGEHRGKCVADGGNLPDTNMEAFGKMVELAGGPNKAVIGVLSISVCGLAEDVKSEWSDHQAWFNKWEKVCGSLKACGLPGSRILNVPFTIDNKDTAQDSQECVEIIRRCTGLWMPGGEHYRATRCMFHFDEAGARTSSSKVYEALQDMYRKGVMIGCTSSGAFCITQGPLVTGGSSIHQCLVKGASEDTKGLRPDLTYDAGGGFAFLGTEKWGSALVEAHCPEKSRLLRLLRLLADTKDKPKGSTFGIGIGENTQLVIDRSTGWVDIQGESSVQLVDISSANFPSADIFSIADVVFHQLTRGDRFHLESGEITVAPWKTKQESSEKEIVTSNDMCKEKLAIHMVAEALVQSKESSVTCTSSEADPSFSMTIEKTLETAGFTGKSEASQFWTLQCLKLSLGPSA